MSSIRTAPCEWPLVDDLTCSALDDVPQDLRDAMVETATSLLWQWTGRVFGRCQVTLRPCRQDCGSTTYRGLTGIPSTQFANMPFLPVLINGEFYNLRCGRGCGEADLWMKEIGLPGPVDNVVSVKVDGQTLDPSDYRVDNRTWLVRTDGKHWPTCQDLTASASDPDTFEVVYEWGTPVPKGGQVAATILACEMAKAALGRDCELPQRVQSVTREGVSVAILDTFEGLEAGRTGIWLVDSWVTSVTKSPRRSQVMSPDTRRPRSTTS